MANSTSARAASRMCRCRELSGYHDRILQPLVTENEILLVSLKKGLRFVRCLGRDGKLIKIALGSNRVADITTDRVIFYTGLTGMDEVDVKTFSEEASRVAALVDLRELWELVVHDKNVLTLRDIGGLYFGDGAAAPQLAGLSVHLERVSIYFTREGHSYWARSVNEIERIDLRRRQRQERSRAEIQVIQALLKGTLPDPASPSERRVIDDFLGFAVHGNSHPRAKATRSMLSKHLPGSRDLQERAFELLVKSGAASWDDPIELQRLDFPTTFSTQVKKLADSIAASPSRSAGRLDFTACPLMTIDNPGTLDRDDGLTIEDLGADRLKIGIHITDATTLIPSQSMIDIEASRRMSTLYTPDIRVPMVPEIICDDAGSLLAGKTRMALTLFATFNGVEILDWELTPSVVQGVDAFTYEQVDDTLRVDKGHRVAELQGLDRAAQALRRARQASGALMLERPELSFRLTGDWSEQRVISVCVLERSTPARRLVAEMMILYNLTIAKLCADQNIPAVYRVQPAFEHQVTEDELSADPVEQYRLMGRISPAKISNRPEKHHGLGVPAYVQVTSPLRRYTDLIMQRQVMHYLANGQSLYSEDQIQSIVHRAEVQLREVALIERQRRHYWFIRYLDQRLKEGLSDYEAIVLDTDRRGPPILEMSDYPHRVRVALSSRAVPGDRVMLRLDNVDFWRRLPNFVETY